MIACELGSKVPTVGGLTPEGSLLHRPRDERRDLIGNRVLVRGDVEAHDDATDADRARRADIGDTAYRGEKILNYLSHLLIHDGRCRARKGGGHYDDRDVDRREEIDAEPEHRYDAEYDNRQKNSNGKNIARDGETDGGIDPAENRRLDVAETLHGFAPPLGLPLVGLPPGDPVCPDF